jgi:hypothetical protein
MSNLSMDSINIITSFLPLDLVSGINRRFHDKVQTLREKSAIKLQRWYRYRRLLEEEPYEEGCTLKTLKRFYITKYKTKWLKRFPTGAIDKLSGFGKETPAWIVEKYTKSGLPIAFVRTFYEFCDDYNMTKEDLETNGW